MNRREILAKIVGSVAGVSGLLLADKPSIAESSSRRLENHAPPQKRNAMTKMDGPWETKLRWYKVRGLGDFPPSILPTLHFEPTESGYMYYLYVDQEFRGVRDIDTKENCLTVEECLSIAQKFCEDYKVHRGLGRIIVNTSGKGIYVSYQLQDNVIPHYTWDRELTSSKDWYTMMHASENNPLPGYWFCKVESYYVG